MKKSSLFNSARFLTLLFVVVCILMSAQGPPPGHEWKEVSQRGKDIVGNPEPDPAKSGDEWWYSHTNLYDAQGNHIGYAACGYLADLVNPGDEIMMRSVFNEGSGSCFNHYPTTGSLFSSRNAACDEFYRFEPLDINGEGFEDRTPFRGIVARLDLHGKMEWCKVLTFYDLQGVIQIGNGGDIYVVGTHQGSKSMNKSGFLKYNPMPGDLDNIFDYDYYTSSLQSTNGAKSHVYVARVELSDGDRVWENLYGNDDFNSNPNTAYVNETIGLDLVYNTNEQHIYAAGRALVGNYCFFVAKINPTNGHLAGKSVFSLPTGQNLHGQSAVYGEAHAICQINSSGDMAVGGIVHYAGTSSTDAYRGTIYKINKYLGMIGGWAANPTQFNPGSTYRGSKISDLDYHPYNDEILVGLVQNCSVCHATSANHGFGEVRRMDPSSGIQNNPGYLGTVDAYDLRVGVTPASNPPGSFAAVSSRRDPNFTPPSDQALGTFSTYCSHLRSVNNTQYAPAYSDEHYGYWDTDALIVKFDVSSNKMWEWRQDVLPGRGRDSMPGDVKRQECLYKITEATDGGLVISGNASSNHDDYYMVKLYNECANNIVYTPGYIGSGAGNTLPVTGNVTWNSSVKVDAQVVIGYGEKLTITGSGTVIRFADSRMTGRQSGIKIEPGGRLDITNGAVVTSIDPSECPGSMWDGIAVMGQSWLDQSYDPTGGKYYHHGYLNVNDATLSNARCGVITGTHTGLGAFIFTSTGGVVKAKDAMFLNNSRDIQFLAYKNKSGTTEIDNVSSFENCTFQVTALLNDKSVPVGRFSMDYVRNVKIKGCKFEYNGGSAYAPGDRGYGILTSDATYRIEDCAGCTSPRTTFKDLTYGLYAVNIMLTMPTVEINHAVFENSYTSAWTLNGGVLMANLNGAKIDACEFDMADSQSESVFMYQSRNYDIRNNIFQGNTDNIGIVASLSGSGNHRIYRNDFTDHYIGIKSQFQNSVNDQNPTLPTDPDDGLVMNCNRFMGSNTFNIALTGFAQPGYYPAVARDQGIVNSNLDKLVRNQYLASCGNEEQWHISQGLSSKNLNHPANVQTYTRPEFSNGCGDPLLFITSNGNFNYGIQCLASGFRPISSNCACNNCCLRDEINLGVATALNTKLSSESAYDAAIDGGNSSGLLATVNSGTMSLPDLKTTLAGRSPYLSDAVLLAYFTNSTVPASDVIYIHNLNKPVTTAVWNAILDRGFPEADVATLTAQQVELVQSPRQVMESELNYVRSELQFMYGEKVAYYLHDTLPGAIDTVIRLLAENIGELPMALADRVDAYALGDYHSRAFALCDSLSAVPAYEHLMGLKHLMLELDTAANNIYKVQQDPALLNRVEDFAADSALPGCFQARALLNKVYGRDMNFLRADPSGIEARPAAPVATGTEEKTSESTSLNLARFEIYPNPATSSFKIYYSTASGNPAGVVISDMLGRKLREQSIVSGQVIEISTEEYNEGLYFISLIEESIKVQNKTIIIMK